MATEQTSSELDPSTPVGRRGLAVDSIVSARRDFLKDQGVELEDEPQTDEPDEPEAPEPEAASGDDDGDGGEPAPAPVEEPTEDGEPEAPAQQEPPQEDAPPLAATVTDDTIVEITVDGKPEQLTMGELKRRASIESAARDRLTTATQILNDAKAKEAEVNELYQQQKQHQPTDEDTTTGADDLGDVDLKGFVHAIQYEDEEAAEDKLRGLIKGLRGNGQGTPGLNPEEFHRQVTNTIIQVRAMEKFGEEYQDILEDPDIAGHAGAIAGRLMKAEIENSQATGATPRPYYDILKEAGDQTRAWLDGLRGGGGQSDENSGDPTQQGKPRASSVKVEVDQDRTQAKRSAPKPPTPRPAPQTATPRQQAPVSVEKQREASRTAAMDEIFKARGQQA